LSFAFQPLGDFLKRKVDHSCVCECEFVDSDYLSFKFQLVDVERAKKCRMEKQLSCSLESEFATTLSRCMPSPNDPIAHPASPAGGIAIGIDWRHVLRACRPR
jgi:hypothetical protein